MKYATINTMKHIKKQDQKIDSGDSMSQKTNEDFNKKNPISTDPGFKGHYQYHLHP